MFTLYLLRLQALAEAVDKRKDEVDELSKQLITHPMVGLKLQEAKDLYQASLSILDKRGPANTTSEREEVISYYSILHHFIQNI
jgi:hypothetical protein